MILWLRIETSLNCRRSIKYRGYWTLITGGRSTHGTIEVVELGGFTPSLME